jgi:hypothetical protein
VIANAVNTTAHALFFAVDDLSSPNVRVIINTTAGAPTTGAVVAFLSDQSVSVNNDPSTPVPVNVVSQTLANMAPIDGVIAASGTMAIYTPAAARSVQLMYVVFGPSAPAAGQLIKLEDGNGTEYGGAIWSATAPWVPWSFDFKPGVALPQGVALRLHNVTASAIEVHGTAVFVLL